VVVRDVHEAISEIPPGETTGEHFIYHLGPAFRPDHPVKTGNVYPSGRKWCMLDRLFTAETVAEACRVSAARQNDSFEFAPR
jgi:hypothetical protein